MRKTLQAFGTTGSGTVMKEKRMRVEPSGESGEKVVEGRSASVDDLKEAEERGCSHLDKGMWLSIEEEKFELKKAKSELKKDLARAKTDVMKEVKQLKASHVVAIGQLQVEAKANLDEIVVERDRLGCHLMLKGYSEEEVDAINTYVEVEDEEEAGVERIVDGLDGVSLQTVLNNQGDDVALPEGGSEKIGCYDLNERVARLKAEKDQPIARAKKAEARERSEGSRTEGHVQKGNANLRECQHKMDATLIREKVLEGEIKEKELLVKRKEELLKDIPAREELNAEIGRLRAQVVDLEALNLSESAKYIAKLEKDAIYNDRVDAKIIEWKDNCARLKVRLERLKARFVTAIVPSVSRSDLLRVIVAYFIEEVKRLESE
ncbi:hypothetical protein GIB67_026072 [Kingdonia uniflora]|uniref:Uncharacterized protein n=1 Tax=Kingdonia uniflora TaxID=39325 RepID=A0A7J7M2Z9_9MAGN|nr:hypothetical protein GIB67_026072 [Kingdonia uniflora]